MAKQDVVTGFHNIDWMSNPDFFVNYLDYVKWNGGYPGLQVPSL